MTNPLTLYTVLFSVSLAPGHPLLFEAGDGEVIVFIFAESPQDAAEKAAEIVACLPYDNKTGVNAKVVEANKLTRSDLVKEEIEQAKRVGFAMCLQLKELEEGVPELK